MQYSKYRPFPDLSINRRQTLAENIADLAAISASYDRYRGALGGKAAERFHRRSAVLYRLWPGAPVEPREAALRRQVAIDVHAPTEFRTATMRNLDAWYRAFNVRPAETLYLAPPDRVRASGNYRRRPDSENHDEAQLFCTSGLLKV